MEGIFSWIVENRELMKLLYGMIITLICIVIVLKTDRLFRLSLHQGIRYFRNAFFFYGLAFITRYFLGAFAFYKNPLIGFQTVKFIFEFLLITAGFFLFYSLLWKRIESDQEDNFKSSLFNKKLFIFYAMAIIIAFLDHLWFSYVFMFISQIILFFCLSIVSYMNYRKKGIQHKFLKLYFIAMIFSLAAWILNAISASYFNWNRGILMNVYGLNIIIFLLFLYGVVNVTRRI